MHILYKCVQNADTLRPIHLSSNEGENLPSVKIFIIMICGLFPTDLPVYCKTYVVLQFLHFLLCLNPDGKNLSCKLPLNIDSKAVPLPNVSYMVIELQPGSYFSFCRWT